MSLYSIGDLASSFLLRRQNAYLNSELGRLAQEMSSGLAADIPRHLDGNYSFLGDLEHGLRINRSYETGANEAALFTDAMQSTLDRVQQTITTLSSDLLLSGNTALPEAVQTASANASDQLQSLLSTLNTNVAGRALFSGAATDTPSFASANTFLTELRTAVSGEVTLSGILSAIDNWFDTPGGGFETLGYLGATSNLSAFPVGEGQSVSLDLRGDAQVMRDLLKNTAIAALASDPALGYSHGLQSQLLVEAGENMMTSQGQLTGIRADLGYAEARIEESRTRLSAERTSLEMARGELLGVDLYETATQLENVQFQLESLYTATARLSQLSLVGYL